MKSRNQRVILLWKIHVVFYRNINYCLKICKILQYFTKLYVVNKNIWFVTMKIKSDFTKTSPELKSKMYNCIDREINTLSPYNSIFLVIHPNY